MSHTPGPWTYTHEGSSSIYIRDNKGCQLYWLGGSTRFETGENEANAHLIAAAPDLLEALEDLLNDGMDHGGSKIRAARSVIAKATGKESA